MNLTLSDINLVQYQIRREPNDIHNVAVRCEYGCPVVITNVPVKLRVESSDDDTDPKVTKKTPGKEKIVITGNIFWLTCPKYHQAIHDLETAGWIKKLKKFISLDTDFRKSIRYATYEYQVVRKSVFKAAFSNTETLSYDNFKRNFTIGIGGLKNFFEIKCLHQHFAHYLVSGKNPLGYAVSRILKRDKLICNNCIKNYNPYKTYPENSD